MRVEAVPSVIESPKAQITCVPTGAITSIASMKYHDVVVNGNAPSVSSLPCAPDPGGVR